MDAGDIAAHQRASPMLSHGFIMRQIKDLYIPTAVIGAPLRVCWGRRGLSLYHRPWRHARMFRRQQARRRRWHPTTRRRRPRPRP